mmetsp:Transcript_16056/g.44173  ORF Transcript_16056/g.44173 Transcript_16056/m.44173 type:complete len:399 (-) Transcript_16056:103-1299(-)
MDRGLGRSPTFLVGCERQRYNLDQLQRREQHLAEQYQKNKPLCYSANAYQKTHPQKAAEGHRDADVTLVSPMLLGVADGVSQIEEYGLDASELPRELLKACEELAMSQLIPDRMNSVEGAYMGPIPLMREAYEATEALGSTTALLAILDNSTRIHGKLHPMIAVLSIGDCELLILRRLMGFESQLEPVFHTEMQRIDGHAQCPLQICRIDDRLDEEFDESIPIEVIERGSAVHCVSAYEGDIVIMGSDGVFDNLFLDEVVSICNEMIPPAAPGGKFVATKQALLGEVARRIVEECHAKTKAGRGGVYPDTPIGKGGKRDDTCCVVGEVVEWTAEQGEYWTRVRRQRKWRSLLTCGGSLQSCCEEGEGEPAGGAREYPHGSAGHRSLGCEDGEDRCCIS